MVEHFIPAIGEDGQLFAMEKLEAHVKGTLHLAISIFVFDGKKLLMQRRAPGKYHSGSLWANTVCTHPNWDEAIVDAAARRLREELGFSVPLIEVGNIDYRAEVGSGMIENERVTLFVGYGDAAELLIKPNPDEVMDFRWVTLDEIRQWMATNPEQFTEWMKIYLDELAELFPG